MMGGGRLSIHSSRLFGGSSSSRSSIIFTVIVVIIDKDVAHVVVGCGGWMIDARVEKRCWFAGSGIPVVVVIIRTHLVILIE